MRRTLAALALVATAACGRTASVSPGGEAPRRAVTVPVAQPSFQVSNPSLTRPRATDIRSAELGGAGRELTLVYGGGVKECWGLHSVTVSYEATRVVVTVYEGDRPPPSRAPGEPLFGCVTIGLYWHTRIALTEPLGSRQLVDGSNGRTVSVRR